MSSQLIKDAKAGGVIRMVATIISQVGDKLIVMLSCCHQEKFPLYTVVKGDLVICDTCTKEYETYIRTEINKYRRWHWVQIVRGVWEIGHTDDDGETYIVNGQQHEKEQILTHLIITPPSIMLKKEGS